MTSSFDEGRYDSARLAQWEAGQARGDGISRRTALRLSAGLGLAAVPVLGGVPASAAPARGEASAAPARGEGPAVAAGPIVKPLPPELFTVFGTNAETRWEALRDVGHLVPIDRFFVRNHTGTPLIDGDTWRLELFGAGLRGSPTADNPVTVSLKQLRRLPSTTLTAFIECAGNGRSFFTTQQGQPVSGTAWKLGAVGVATWRGVRLSTVLRLAGLRPDAVDVLPSGLDANFVSGGVDLGPVRRPIPIRKALHDVVLAYEMNGEPLPPDHGFPVRVVVPSWIGISSIKWVGRIEVSAEPLFTPWNTQFYRFFGPDHPAEGSAPLTRQVVKSAFELAPDAQLPVGTTTLLTGRAWSGNGGIRRVDVSTDGGASWRRADLFGPAVDTGWRRWRLTWRPATPGGHTLLARATDATGATQPDVAPYNTLGYQFGAVVRHPVTVA
ncbi:sulfite oxidase [Virgisporangium ochraceum]|uniref:Oxidoreductase n=1 Tax=Virgisporangium ochraceum TaxID=65505 RepID=A0A8J3ZYG0_9ACTN|nr:sulfite oxidase [Virgisporangium ochraceum]GIJ71167.1 oxidoreductase [Virgisporangium ochraceum]